MQIWVETNCASLLLNGRGVSPELARPLLVSYLDSCGARVSEAPLDSPPAGDGWYSVRAGDGASGVAATEPIVLLKAEFDEAPQL